MNHSEVISRSLHAMASAMRLTLMLALMLGAGVSLAQDDADEESDPSTETPQAPGEPQAQAQPAAPALTEAQTEALRKQYLAADARGRAELTAYYKDFGVDLVAALGITETDAQRQARADQIVQAIQQLAFTRSPREVLAMRARISTDLAFPDPARAAPFTLAQWIHRRTIAGDWDGIATMLGAMPSDSAASVGSGLLMMLSEGNAGLLPEEVLDVAAILPSAPTDADVTVLSRMLAPAAAKHGSALLMRRLVESGGHFGDSPESRRRTLSLLEQADLIAEAYNFLPPLEPALESGDVLVVMAHGRYLDEHSRRLAEGPEKDLMRRQAFGLYSKATSIAGVSNDDSREAVQRSFALMPWLPRSMVDPWLAELFADPARTRIAAEVLAVEADKLQSADLTPRERANAVIGIARSAEAMLSASHDQADELRAPLSVLASAISGQMEAALTPAENESGRRSTTPRNRLESLMQAAPSEAWMNAIEPSVAVRVGKAVMGLAVELERIDEAIVLLGRAVARSPDDGPALTRHLLDTWGTWLASQSVVIDDDWYYYPYYARYNNQTLTRAQQQRNLDSLRRLIDIMRELGIDAKQLDATLGVFRACHQSDEIYRKQDIEAVFGDPRKLPVLTATILADTIRANVLTYWRAQTQPPASGSQRKAPPPTAELRRQANTAYDTAIMLLEAARESSPGNWRVEAVAASVNYDRLSLNESLGMVDPADRVEILGEAYLAFERAAVAYADALSKAEQVESADIYSRWFRAALGSSDISRITASQIPEEGSIGDVQLDRIKEALTKLPEDEWNRHLGAFADEISGALNQAPAEAKPKLVRSALRVIGEHEAGAPFRKLNQLYLDLAKNDLRLVLSVHGDTAVTAERPFATLLTLRYTNAIERSAGDLGMYLSNNIERWNMYTREWTTRDYRDDLERQIRQAFSKGYDLQSIAWFAPSHPSRTVLQDDQDGWLEKPLAIIYAAPKDTTVDRLPQVEMQMYFQDGSGEAVVLMQSSTPTIRTQDEFQHRPLTGLQVTQTVDTRNAKDPKKPEVTIEVAAKARGVVPEIADLLNGYEQAVHGFTLLPENIETADPIFQDPTAQPTVLASTQPIPDAPVVDDQLGFELPIVERSWRLAFTPDGKKSTGNVTLASLHKGLEGSLANRAYGETDLIELSGSAYAFEPRRPWLSLVIIAVAALAVAIGVIAFVRRRLRDTTDEVGSTLRMPKHHTPMAIIMTLRQWHKDAAETLEPTLRAELESDIGQLEESLFGPRDNAGTTQQLLQAIAKWETVLKHQAV